MTRSQRAVMAGVLVTLLAAPNSNAGQRPQTTLASVEALAAAQHLAEALAACNGYLARHPHDRRARILHADLLAWTGDIATALPAYERLLQETPADGGLRLRRALARQWQGDLITAETEMAALAPNDPEAATQLAALRALPEWPLAQARAAVAAHPTDVEATVALVQAVLAADQTWEAQEILAAGLIANPGNARLQALKTRVDQRAVTAAAARIEQRHPTLATADDGDPRRIEQAGDLNAVGQLAAAANEYGRFARAHPERRDMRLQEARVRSWYGDLGRAATLYDGLIADEPNDVVTQLEAARVLAWDGRLIAAARAAAPLRQRPDVGPGATALLGDLARWDGARVGPAALYADALARGLDGDAAHEARYVLSHDASSWLLTPEYRWFRDSEGFTSVAGGLRVMRQVDFATRLQATFFHLDYQQHGRGVTAERGAFSLEHEWTQVRATVEFGASGYSSGPVRPAAAVRVEWFPRVETLLGAGYEHYDLLDEVTTLRAVTREPTERGPRILQGDRAHLWLRWPLPGDVRLTADASLAAITDGNRSDSAALTLARRLWRRPRIDLGVDIRTYGVAEHQPRYWSPTRYWTTGATVSVEQTLCWGLTLRGEGRGGYAEEDGTTTAEVSYAVALTTDPNQPWTIALGYHGGQSARSGGYGVDGVTATVTYRPGASTP